MTNNKTANTMDMPIEETVTGGTTAREQKTGDAGKPVDRLATLKVALAESRGAQFLTAVLVVQLLFAGALLWQSTGDADFVSSNQIVTLDAQAVDELIIDGGEDDATSITLRRSDEGWQVLGDANHPADVEKVTGIIDTLATLTPGLPVATTEEAREQLEVADDVFQRRLRVKQGDEQVADLYLGSSPGFRKAHLRKADEQAIYAARINVFDLPLITDDWLDKQLLAYDSVDSLGGEGIELAREGDTWRIVEPAAQSDTFEVATDRVESIVSALQGLRVTGIASAEESEGISIESDQASDTNTDTNPETDLAQTAENEVENEVLELSVGSGDNTIVLNLQRRGDDVVAARSDIPGEFNVTTTLFDTLSEFNADTILVALPEEQSDTEAVSSNSEPADPESFSSD